MQRPSDFGRGDAALGALIFELSEFERGQPGFVCTAFDVTQAGLRVGIGELTVDLPLASTRERLRELVAPQGRRVCAPHRGALPDIDSHGPHDDWVELLRDLAFGPEDLASTGTGALLGASTDGRSAVVSLRTKRGDRAFGYAFDGTYPAAVALDFATDDA